MKQWAEVQTVAVKPDLKPAIVEVKNFKGKPSKLQSETKKKGLF